MYDQQRANQQANFEPFKHHGRTVYTCGDFGAKYGIAHGGICVFSFKICEVGWLATYCQCFDAHVATFFFFSFFA
jgi:hypothetical protein